LQEYGVGVFDALPTKSGLKKALKKNLVLVNGKVATSATYIRGGEKITFLGNAVTVTSKRLRLDLDVIYEDEHIAVINKPAGLLVSGNTFKSVTNALSQNLKVSNEQDAVSPKPVHRLDYPTTGLLLVGKTVKTIVCLNKMFENKEIHKKYLAVTLGEMPKEGKLNIPIDTKAAISTFKILNTVVSTRFKFLNLVELVPETGRRHQLRKHMAAIGNPILGDKDYGLPNLILQGKGLYLQANSLAFAHPVTNVMINLRLPIPQKINKIFDNTGLKKSPAVN